MRFFSGLIIGLLALAGYAGYEFYQSKEDPCRGFCGQGTQCIDQHCVVEDDSPKKNKKKGRRKRRRNARRPLSDPTLKTPSAADLKVVIKGQSLKQTDYIDMSKADPNLQELSSDEVEAKFRRLDPKIIACIDKARGNWNVAAVKIVIGFRVERSGAINKVQLKAPILMQKSGLYSCIKPLVSSLHFPKSARSIVMSYPYQLK